MTVTASLSIARAAQDDQIDGAIEEDRGIELVRPIPLGIGFAPGSRLRLEYPGEQFDPFLRLALIEPTGPSFWAVEPGRLFDDYIVVIPEADVECLGLIDQSDVVVFVLVSPGREAPTVNLYAPIVINLKTKRAMQVILEESGYACAVPINSGTARPVSEIHALT